MWYGPSWRWKYLFLDNPGKDIVEKSTKLSYIGFSIECGQLSSFPWIPSISGISLKFRNFLRSWAVWQFVWKLVYSPCGDNLVSFHLWWTEIELKCKKVYKYFFLWLYFWSRFIDFLFFAKQRKGNDPLVVMCLMYNVLGVFCHQVVNSKYFLQTVTGFFLSSALSSVRWYISFLHSKTFKI